MPDRAQIEFLGNHLEADGAIAQSEADDACPLEVSFADSLLVM
jgi:hypothetical protein